MPVLSPCSCAPPQLPRFSRTLPDGLQGQLCLQRNSMRMWLLPSQPAADGLPSVLSVVPASPSAASLRCAPAQTLTRSHPAAPSSCTLLHPAESRSRDPTPIDSVFGREA